MVHQYAIDSEKASWWHRNTSTRTLDDRIHRASLLTEPTVDALGHVNVCMPKKDAENE